MLFDVQVTTNGYFAFDREMSSCCITSFDSVDSYNYIVAPFLSDIDTSTTGEISYEIHTTNNSPEVISRYNEFVRSKDESKFIGTWMIIAEWKRVPLSGASLEMVSTYVCNRNDIL